MISWRGAALLDEPNTAVIARFNRATQYSRGVQDRPKGHGLLDRPVKPGDDSFECSDRLSGVPLFVRATASRYAARAFGATGGARTFQSGASCSRGSVIACSFSSVIPGIISNTTRPFGVTSMTARLV